MTEPRRRPPSRAEKPIRRVNPSGKVVWLARYTSRDGRRKIAKPRWNRGGGTFTRQADAQRAIVEAYEVEFGLSPRRESVGGYFETWTARHPRSQRTNATNDHRISRVLEAEIDGRPLRHWRLDELRRRHVLALVDHMLGEQGRAQLGAIGILRALSTLFEDAITDEVAGANPFKGVKVRANDPRIKKSPRETRVWSFEQMHAFARAAGRWEPMVRTFADTGMRLGEVLPLRREDLDEGMFRVRRTAHEGRIERGTKADHGEASAGRAVPCPAELAELIQAMPARIDTELLFPTKTGRLWRNRNFYRDVWEPARNASGLDIRPHEMRHSYVTHLRAAGVDDADLAAIAGHRVETMLAHYTHPLGRSYDRIRQVIG
ncbi:MAG: tyrosine-type recombinase/integrase [Solirubrobacterales bacterium]|nr:tyrosine-type recombinase/integrase [Solirubrobacterales bacterium]